jgi:hypothetical protein
MFWAFKLSFVVDVFGLFFIWQLLLFPNLLVTLLSITTLDAQCCYTGCHYAEHHGTIYTSLVRILKKRASYLKVGTNSRKTVYKIAYDSDSTILVLTSLENATQMVLFLSF